MNEILAVIVALFLAIGQDPAQETIPSQQSSVELISEAAQADLIKDVLVPAREPGILRQLLVKEGDWVTANQPIAELDRELNELDVQAAKLKQKISELKATDDVDKRYSIKSKEVAAATLARSQSAVENFRNSISKTELEQLRLEVERATLSIEKSEFERKLAVAETDLYASEADAAKIKLGYRSIQSPIEGMVVEVISQEGEWVTSGQTLIRVVQLDRMRIKALLPSNKIDQSFIGRRAVFEPEIAGGKFEGTIYFVSPEILPGTGKVQFWFDVDNPDRQLRRREDGTVRIIDR